MISKEGCNGGGGPKKQRSLINRKDFFAGQLLKKRQLSFLKILGKF